MAGQSAAAADSRGSFRSHLSDPLYRTGYLLIVGSGATSILGFVFWTAAAHTYSARVVGLNSAAISAMILLSGACQLGLNTVLVRYIPIAGRSTRSLVLRSYAVTAGLSLVGGTIVALSSPVWAPSLSFLAHDIGWLTGFVMATTCWTLFSLQDAVMTGLQAPHWVPIENSLFSVAKLAVLLAIAGASTLAGPFVAWNAPVAVAVLCISVLIFRQLIPARQGAPAAGSIAPGALVRVTAGNYAASLFGIGVLYLMPVVVADATNPTKTAYFYAPWLIATVVLVVANNTSTSLTVEAALDEQQLAQLLRRSLVHTLRLLVPLVALVALAAPVILELFNRRYAHAGSPLLRLLAAGALPNALVTLGLAVARVQQRPLLLIAIQAGEFILLVALSLILLPSMGIAAVGVAFLASQGAVAIGLIAAVLRPLLPGAGRATPSARS